MNSRYVTLTVPKHLLEQLAADAATLGLPGAREALLEAISLLHDKAEQARPAAP